MKQRSTLNGDTRERIIQAAVIVFSRKGFEGATLKEITEMAEANIASVNYYFRSKDELIRQLIQDLLTSVNTARLAALDSYEADKAAGAEPSLVRLLDAMIRPMVQLASDMEGGRDHISLLLQARTIPYAVNQPDGGDDQAFHERFLGHLESLLPSLSRTELVWRYDFARGAMMFILADMSPNIHRIVQVSGMPSAAEEDTIVAELTTFVEQGLKAPSAGTGLAKPA